MTPFQFGAFVKYALDSAETGGGMGEVLGRGFDNGVNSGLNAIGLGTTNPEAWLGRPPQSRPPMAPNQTGGLGEFLGQSFDSGINGVLDRIGLSGGIAPEAFAPNRSRPAVKPAAAASRPLPPIQPGGGSAANMEVAQAARRGSPRPLRADPGMPGVSAYKSPNTITADPGMPGVSAYRSPPAPQPAPAALSPQRQLQNAAAGGLSGGFSQQQQQRPRPLSARQTPSAAPPVPPKPAVPANAGAGISIPKTTRFV